MKFIIKLISPPLRLTINIKEGILNEISITYDQVLALDEGGHGGFEEKEYVSCVAGRIDRFHSCGNG